MEFAADFSYGHMKMAIWRFKCDTFFQNHLVALGATGDGVFSSVFLHLVPTFNGRNLRKFSKETSNNLLPEDISILGAATGGLSEHHRPIFTM